MGKGTFMVSNYYFLMAILVGIVSFPILLQAAGPFNLQYYGNYKEMLHTQKLEGVVDLKTVLSAPHTYAVGALDQGKGEITVIDGKIWLTSVRNNSAESSHTIRKREKAVLLVSAQVRNWQEVSIPYEMPEPEWHRFVLEQAKLHGLDTEAPFPFLLKGSFKDLKWHVINGRNPKFQGHGGPHFLNKLSEHRLLASGTIVGFFSAAIQGVFTHPGESWHMHVVLANKNGAGHVDGVTLEKGIILKIPKP